MQHIGPDNPIILLTVDSLRADEISKDTLPNSRKFLDADFVYFSNAKSYGVATPFAFPGIISGSHPVGDGNIPNNASTLAERVSGKSIGLSNNSHLRPDRGYNRGFTRFEEDPSIGETKHPDQGLVDYFIKIIVEYGEKIDMIRQSPVVKKIYNEFIGEQIPISYRTAPEMVEIAQDALEENPPSLLWGHWMDPHLPYHPETAIDLPSDLPEYSVLSGLFDRIIGNSDHLNDAEGQLARELYRANIRYFDHHFSKLLSSLQDKYWYDKALIAVISDHGEYFGEHDLYFHEWQHDPHDVVINTPLWVKYPEQVDGGKTFDHIVGHGDLLATIESGKTDDGFQAPHYTAPLRKETGRHVVSISNVSKRLTESTGTHIVRRNGTTVTRGTVSDDGTEFVDSLPFPDCRNSKGEAEGVGKAERQRRLQNLGYTQ